MIKKTAMVFKFAREYLPKMQIADTYFLEILIFSRHRTKIRNLQFNQELR